VFSEECSKKPFDVVMHFAAKLIVPESVSKPLEYYYNNVEGVRLMLEVMTEFNIKNVVFSSTAAVYGDPVKPICKEEDITVPINPYGDSKLASEKMIKWVCKAYNMNYCIFRYFNVAGADESLEIGLKKDTLTHLVPICVQTLLGLREKMSVFGDDFDTKDGTGVRDYIHVSDLAYAHVLGAKYITNNNKSVLLNLGSNEGYSVKEVIEEVSKYGKVNYEIAPRREGDPAKLIASNSKAKETLGWTPKRGLKDIIQSDIEYRKKINNK
jgi:UDP-glucose 4-epimerase